MHGLPSGLHQHTGICVESRDETYAVMDAVNTKYVRFAPDIGQLTKGGADALQVVKDHLSIVEHMHLKDYDGKDRNMVGYCPLGQGKVDVIGILDVIEKKEKKTKLKGMVMVELDYDNKRGHYAALSGYDQPELPCEEWRHFPQRLDRCGRFAFATKQPWRSNERHGCFVFSAGYLSGSDRTRQSGDDRRELALSRRLPAKPPGESLTRKFRAA